MGNEFMITPIQKNKVYEDISTQIKQQIEDGTRKEGERIQGGNRTRKRIPGWQKFHKRGNKIFAGVRNPGGTDWTGNLYCTECVTEDQ